ncbi:MAG: hypothetical protein ACM34G_08070 [Acidobacteriota bacterium]
MKRYWQFLLVGVICLLVALLWAQPPQTQGARPGGATATSSSAAAASAASTTAAGTKDVASSTPTATPSPARSDKNSDADPLPGSSSSLPVLAVIGFGVLAGGITSAMRTR